MSILDDTHSHLLPIHDAYESERSQVEYAGPFYVRFLIFPRRLRIES